ncbi:hypothetical protein N7468_007241 [Penicillium chermesinum]|uniref:Alpha/beta hydrolase fold-3 domain-containing protein n=1 Tax=Penicillium chermesinum TaxID=63820 RepID=A0A9W9NUG0_9EURO|nr:uncharacterized protein N7468_007241 [Penicillium chermesinum]KAJ5226016.1 hypothetical protein N7468_007241 [Penicillium chermesinum]KAJ6160788.1 hypothetical protein N7470_004184 [Penicillium chermesinum]
MPLHYDRDFEQAAAPFFAARAARPFTLNTALDIRAVMGPSTKAFMSAVPVPPGVTEEKHEIKSYDGQSITVYRYWKKGANKATPAVVHTHGGGMVFGEANTAAGVLSTFVEKTGVQIFTVDYRLAPEHPFPTPPEDSYAALAWVNQHASELSVDPARIATMGESAGGNLAAAISLMARDRGLSPPLAKQILIYPMLDDRNVHEIITLKDLALWTIHANRLCWSAYLGSDFGTDRVSQYAAPARAMTLEGLPATYIDVGQLDIFHGEAMQYAARLAEAGVEVEFSMFAGVPHIWDMCAPQCAIAKRAAEGRERALSALWN